MHELHALAGTCKRFSVICGAYFLRNYPASAVCIDDGVIAYRHQWNDIIFGVKLNVFCQYMEKLIIPNGRLNQFKYAGINCGESMLSFVGVTLTDCKIKCIEHILSRIQCVELIDCKMNGHFYETFLKYCHQLKCLKLCNLECKTLENYGHDWMLRKYKTLKHLQLIRCKHVKRSELEIFFELNPNILRFEIDSDLFWRIKVVILDTSVKWNDLIIHFQNTNNPITVLMYSLLNTFHKRGHFKRLHLRYGNILSQQFIDRIGILHALVSLHLKGDPGSVLPPLNYLTELHTFCGNFNMEKSVNNLTSLEKIVFREANIDDVVSVIRKCVKLKVIKVRTLNEKSRPSAIFDGKKSFSHNALNVVALNEQRKQLQGAGKVTIFVNEDIFLATKWTTANETNHSLIEVRRSFLLN